VQARDDESGGSATLDRIRDVRTDLLVSSASAWLRTMW
jgi:hypothetical protein